MDRRELLKMIALLTGGAVIGGESLLTGCRNPEAEAGLNFTETDVALMDELGETILPATKTPGAKAAHIGQFMKTAVTDCYSEDDQKIFRSGLKDIDDRSEKKFSHEFLKANPDERKQLLIEIDAEAKKQQDERDALNKSENKREEEARAKGDKSFVRKKTGPVHYFTLMKQLTLWGYFTSKEGMTEALRFNPVPGRYEGCIDYKKGDRMFSKLG